MLRQPTDRSVVGMPVPDGAHTHLGVLPECLDLRDVGQRSLGRLHLHRISHRVALSVHQDSVVEVTTSDGASGLPFPPDLRLILQPSGLVYASGGAYGPPLVMRREDGKLASSLHHQPRRVARFKIQAPKTRHPFLFVPFMIVRGATNM